MLTAWALRVRQVHSRIGDFADDVERTLRFSAALPLQRDSSFVESA